MANGNLDDIRTNNNTAQAVLKTLEELNASQAWVRTRWIWELLQNARDAGASTVTVEYAENKIIFQHNGHGFTAEEICHLIYHGSTKTDDTDTIGRYGSGFLTTHLLSNDIWISGRLNTNQRFDFWLTRQIISVDELKCSMDDAWDKFQESLIDGNLDTRTEFHYPLNNNDQSVNAAVEHGIDMLMRCAPYIVIFNNFSDIKVKYGSETTTFNVQSRDTDLSSGQNQEPVHQFIVEETRNGNIIRYERRYIVASDDIAQVAIPFESHESYTECKSLCDIPKLFVGFPLIHTEEFGFPAVINSLKFTPTEKRDGVYLGQNDDEVNRRNEKVVRRSCGLLVRLIECAVESGWRGIYELGRVPKIVGSTWLNENWLRETLRKDFVDRIRKSAIVINESGVRIPPDCVRLPSVDGDGVLDLWDLAMEWGYLKDSLPRRVEAAGWRDAAISWEAFNSEIEELYDGTCLANDIQDISHDPNVTDVKRLTHRVNRLDVEDRIGWLNRVISFLIKHDMRKVIVDRKVVPSQEGFLRTLPTLYQDNGVDEELKKVASLVDGWRIRPELRHAEIHALDDEPGAGRWDNDTVVGPLIERLSAHIENTGGDDISHQASARLFAWMVRNQDWNRLSSLPVFSEQYRGVNGQDRDVLKIGQSVGDDMVLSPVASWGEDVRPYAGLFPKRHILAHFYFEMVSDDATWVNLENARLIRRSVIVKEDTCHVFLSDDVLSDEDHRTLDAVPVTNIAFISKGDIGIIDRVRGSTRLARALWRFLTEWMVNIDHAGLEARAADCICGERHSYYPAGWIKPIVERKWVPVDGGSKRASAQSLAAMLRGSGWSPDLLEGNAAVISFLEAIDVTEFDLTREFTVTTDDERKAQERSLTRIIASGDLNHVVQFVEDWECDQDLPAFLDKRRERRRIVHDNQRIGAQVEQLVKLTLEVQGFQVTRHGIGADFRIEFSDAGRLELERAGQTWLVEVKATREAAVRMTERQVRAAVEERSRFLLCVVPIASDQLDEPTLEDVQNTMRFVSNIGNRLEGLCEDLDEFVTLRDEITGEENDGLQLEVESGAVRVRVVEAVWTDGFPLAELSTTLCHRGTP